MGNLRNRFCTETIRKVATSCLYIYIYIILISICTSTHIQKNGIVFCIMKCVISPICFATTGSLDPRDVSENSLTCSQKYTAARSIKVSCLTWEASKVGHVVVSGTKCCIPRMTLYTCDSHKTRLAYVYRKCVLNHVTYNNKYISHHVHIIVSVLSFAPCCCQVHIAFGMTMCLHGLYRGLFPSSCSLDVLSGSSVLYTKDVPAWFRARLYVNTDQ